MSHLDDVLAASRRAAAERAAPETGFNLEGALFDARKRFLEENHYTCNPFREVSVEIAGDGLIAVRGKVLLGTDPTLFHDEVVADLTWLAFEQGPTDISWEHKRGVARYVMTTTCDDLFFSVDVRFKWATARYAERWKK